MEVGGSGGSGLSRGGRGLSSTHAEAQGGSEGQSVPGAKQQAALAAVHVPTAAVERPAQSRAGPVIGAGQRALNTTHTHTQHAAAQQASGGREGGREGA